MVAAVMLLTAGGRSVTPRLTASCAQVISTSRAASGTTCGHIGVSAACTAAAAPARSSDAAMAARLPAAMISANIEYDRDTCETGHGLILAAA